MKMLNKTGPSIEPCRISAIIFFPRTRFLNYTKFPSLEIDQVWLSVSMNFERSVKIAET